MRKVDPEKRRLWAARLRRQASSGMTVSEFCESEGVSKPSFYHWRRKLKEDVEERQLLGGFQPLQLVSPPAAMTVRLNNGAIIEVSGGAIDTVLAGLLRDSQGEATC